jgi:hypothetical protein
MLFYGGDGEMAVSGTSSMVGVMGCRWIKQVRALRTGLRYLSRAQALVLVLS